jgi:hypothetical protein
MGVGKDGAGQHKKRPKEVRSQADPWGSGRRAPLNPAPAKDCAWISLGSSGRGKGKGRERAQGRRWASAGTRTAVIQSQTMNGDRILFLPILPLPRADFHEVAGDDEIALSSSEAEIDSIELFWEIFEKFERNQLLSTKRVRAKRRIGEREQRNQRCDARPTFEGESDLGNGSARHGLKESLMDCSRQKEKKQTEERPTDPEERTAKRGTA